MDTAGLLIQRFFKRNYKMADEDSHSTDSSVSGDERSFTSFEERQRMKNPQRIVGS